MNVVVDYSCEDCDVEGVKLWRQYQTFEPDLVCVDCAGERQPDEDISKMDPDGNRPYPDAAMAERGIKTCQIGWYVPAIPVDDADAFWGYTSVPEGGIRWWRDLPLRHPSGEPLTIEQAIIEYAAIQGWKAQEEYPTQRSGFCTIGDLFIVVPWKVIETKTINGIEYTRERMEERTIFLNKSYEDYEEKLESLVGPVKHVNVVFDRMRERIIELTKVENLR